MHFLQMTSLRKNLMRMAGLQVPNGSSISGINMAAAQNKQQTKAGDGAGPSALVVALKDIASGNEREPPRHLPPASHRL